MSNPREDSYGDDANEAENPGGARLQAEDPSIARATDLNGSRIHFHKQRPRTDHIARGGQHRTRNSPEATNMICDFCNAPNPVWRFSARPFVVDYGTMASASDADWAACDACRDLILADDRNGLVDRAMVTAPVIPGLAD